MSTCRVAVELELKQRSHDHPDVARLGRALSDEVLARGAHADDVAAEQRTTIADAVASEGEILVAYSDGAAVGIGGLRPLGGGVGEVKRMYVVPEYRGAGVAKRILDALEQLARERGFEAVRLDTHERLGEANRLYRSAGYREIEDYNGNPSANRWFEKPLA
jgi:GNAT superfamily N-acetyltransferase